MKTTDEVAFRAYVRQIMVRAFLDERRRPWRRETVTEGPTRCRIRFTATSTHMLTQWCSEMR